MIAWRGGVAVSMPQAAVPSAAAPYDLIAIVASAGGLRAMETILAWLPRDFPVPIAIVQHRTSERPEVLARVLSRHCRLVVKLVSPGEALRPGVVYVAAPQLHLVVNEDRSLGCIDGHRVRHVLSSANPLFESAARVLGARVIAVVLTGYDSDGTDGVQAVHQAGGIVIAQDEATSRVFAMPQSAIATGAVDRVLPIEAIGQALVELATARSASSAAAAGSA